MSYTALARKWRPKRFAEMVGQQHVLQALANALAGGRVHHAFLFTGTRGVGKTSVARILARCLNCETGVTAEPCGECSACRAIDEGRFIDLIEVDAASRAKVDETRELLENVQYAPSAGRYKVYLIDEVHMLSQHSFNALLKTLEEPPPHVKFLLATTDPQRLPVTVLSRCLQFSLKRLPVNLIAARMAEILEAEGIGFEAPALTLLAHAADGSMRDGLSLLDQLIAFGGGSVTTTAAREMLGTIDRERVAAILDALATGDARRVIDAAHALEEWAPDYGAVLDELAGVLVQVALRQAVPDYDLSELPDAALVERLAATVPAEDVQLYYQTAIIGRRDLPLAPDPRTGFDMVLLRMLAFRLPGDGAVAKPGAQPAPAVRTAVAPNTRGAAPVGDDALSAAGWPQLVASLDLSGLARQFAAHCAFLGRQGRLVRLGLDARHAAMRTPTQEDRLARALSRRLGETVRLEIEVVEGELPTPAADRERESAADLEAARATLAGDPAVRALQEKFGATLHPESVRPTGK
ncbi:MAG TPA: DNA polymerase III subunit gamma/tau [Steroidobacteraceae bacterium]|nr:DNA polymerase III subunit gamma/tau [Steroidobacteraceae bacterium]HNS27182.1 DNA polymerase III subunit gamma/tau [Steroidobacteraceae bacterium]